MKTKRRFAWRGASLMVVGALLLAGCDWPMFRLNPEHTGQSSDNKINVGNVSTLRSLFVASTGGSVDSSPAVANGVVYIGSSDGKLYAFDAAGNTGCSGSPRTCKPLWTATTGGAINFSSPAVANGTVYIGSNDGKLYAYDAAGTTGCSGTPKICNPLWTANLGGEVYASPVVANGSVYLGSFSSDPGGGRLYAFDAAGKTGCSGTPKTCGPLWSTVPSGFGDSSPAVANGVVSFGTFSGYVVGFDAAGIENCTGTPKICSPVGGAQVAYSDPVESSPAIGPDGGLYIGTDNGDWEGGGGDYWASNFYGPGWSAITYSQVRSSPAVANGVVYVGTGNPGELSAYNAAGTTGCSGTPKICNPLWTAPTGGSYSSPAVVNGVVYVGTYAFDAAGTTHCSGTPKTCDPLWTATNGGTNWSSPAVANGRVYIGSTDGKLYAYGLP